MFIDSRLNQHYSLPNTTTNNHNNNSGVLLFQNIPVVILNEIQDFLIPIDFFKLIHSSNQFLRDVKKEIRKYYLKTDDITRFLQDPKFKEKILSKIKDPKRQLQFFYNHPPDLSTLQLLLSQPTHTLIIDSTQLHEIPNWIELLLNHVNVRLLRGNEIITSFDHVEKEKSENIRRLYLYNFTRLNNVQELRFIQHLVLDKCPALIDVSSLSRINHLTLRNCQNIIDISSLGHVKYLTLNHCRSIYDISGLTHNHSLTIFSCPNIDCHTIQFHHTNILQHLSTDLLFSSTELLTTTSLKTLILNSISCLNHIFYVPSSVRIVDIAIINALNLVSFQYCHKVIIRNCYTILDLSPLYSIPFVELHSLSQQQVNCHGLGGNRKVSLINCIGIRDYSALKTIPRLYFHSMYGMSRSEVIRDCFAHCKELVFIDCDLKSVEFLGQVKDLTIISCPIESTADGIGTPMNTKITFDKQFLATKKESITTSLLSWLSPTTTSSSSSTFSSFWKEHYTKEIVYEDNDRVTFLRRKNNYSH